MNGKIKNLKLVSFIPFFLFLLANGQTEIKQREIADDLTKITEQQRELLRENARYFKNFEKKKLASLLCWSGDLSMQYKLPDINSCVDDQVKAASVRTDLWSEKKLIETEKKSVYAQLNVYRAKEQLFRRKTSNVLQQKLEEIKEREMRDLVQATTVNERELIRERSAEEQERAKKEAADEIRIYQAQLELETKPLTEKEKALDNREYLVYLNQLILSQNDPESDMRFVNSPTSIKVQKNLLKEFSASEIIEIKKMKIADIKQKFTAMNSEVSENFRAEAIYFFKKLDEAVAKGADKRVSEVLLMIANDEKIEIDIITDPTDAEIYYRKCGDAEYTKFEKPSRTTMKLDACKYKIRVVSKNDEHRCAFVQGFVKNATLFFKFENARAQLCNPAEMDKDTEKCIRD